MAAVEESEETPLSALDEACRLLKAHFKVLLDVIQPDEMCDELYSADILSDEVYEFVSNREKSLKDRKRRLLYTALQRMKGYRERIEAFLALVEKIESELIQKLCVQIRGQLVSSTQ